MTHTAPPEQPRATPGTTDFTRRTVIAVLIAVGIVGVAYLLGRGVNVLFEAFAGVVFAVFLAALSEWLSKYTRLPYRWSLAVVVLALCLLTGGLGYWLWSVLAAQFGELTQDLPRAFDQIKAFLVRYPWGKSLVENAPEAASGMAQKDGFTRLTGLFSGVAGFLEAGVVILIVGIFGAAEPGLYKEGLLHLVPPKHRPRTGEAVTAVAFNLRHWIVGQAILMVIIGVTTSAGLWVIGVPLALTLGIIAGVLEIIPYVGTWLSVVPAALIALLKGPEYMVYTLALYLALHVLEGYVMLPLIQRRSVRLAPALTIVAQILLGQLFGIMGLFVAAPLTVTVMVLMKMLYVEDTLGDRAVDVPGEPGNVAQTTPQTG